MELVNEICGGHRMSERLSDGNQGMRTMQMMHGVQRLDI